LRLRRNRPRAAARVHEVNHNQPPVPEEEGAGNGNRQ
jgi:hypothetical protein